MGTLSSELAPLRAAQARGPLVYGDANLPAPLVNYMRQHLQWDVLHVIDEPLWRRATDVAHFYRARDLRRTLITLDHDYLGDRCFPPLDSPGVVVLSAPDHRGLSRLLDEVNIYLRASSAPLPLAGRKLCLRPGWTARSCTAPA